MMSASIFEIFERSLGYRGAQDALIERARLAEDGHPYTRFFEAAETVTKLFGIGMVDPLELHEADQFKSLFDVIDEVGVNQQCTGLSKVESLMIGRPARRILRTINWELYHNVNLPERKRFHLFMKCIQRHGRSSGIGLG